MVLVIIGSVLFGITIGAVLEWGISRWYGTALQRKSTVQSSSQIKRQRCHDLMRNKMDAIEQAETCVDHNEVNLPLYSLLAMYARAEMTDWEGIPDPPAKSEFNFPDFSGIRY